MGWSWLLPASAAAFWAGLLLGGVGTSEPQGPPGQAWVALVGGLVLATVSVWSREPARSESEPLLGSAGLMVEAPEPTPRERILLAAGVPRRRDTPSGRSWTPGRAVALLVGVALVGAGWSSRTESCAGPR